MDNVKEYLKDVIGVGLKIVVVSCHHDGDYSVEVCDVFDKGRK